MKDLFQVPIYNGTVARIRTLKADMTPQWGVMSPAAAICHLYDCFNYTFAVRSAPVRSSFYLTTLGKWVIISSPIPWPKGKIRSAPEFLQTKPSGDFGADVAMLLDVLSRYQKGPQQRWGVSPVFGRLSPKQWARLGWRHLSHHLCQFGV